MFLTALLAGASGSPVLAAPSPWDQPVEAPVAASAWTFDFFPYYWSASISGSLTVDGQEVGVSGDSGGDGFFGDPALLGFLGNFEAHKGPWSFVFAPIFISADMEGEGQGNTDADISIDAQVHEAFAAYQFAEGWDVMAGLRYQKLETDLDLSLGGTPVGLLDSKRSWTDPIVGVRYHTMFSKDWSVHARADIGGFGLGSDFVWNASLMAGYQFSSVCGVHLGYRALSFDFKDGSGGDELAYDLSMFGPIIGVSFSF